MKIAEKFRLDNKVAIITGSSKGIGKAIAMAFGQQGAKVVISSRKQEAVDEVVDKFKKAKIEVYGVAAHMGDLDQIRNLVDVTNAHYGGIDIIVNNAAINPTFGPITQTDSAVFDKIFQINVKGPLELAKLAYPLPYKCHQY